MHKKYYYKNCAKLSNSGMFIRNVVKGYRWLLESWNPQILVGNLDWLEREVFKNHKDFSDYQQNIILFNKFKVSLMDLYF